MGPVQSGLGPDPVPGDPCGQTVMTVNTTFLQLPWRAVIMITQWVKKRHKWHALIVSQNKPIPGAFWKCYPVCHYAIASR